MDSPIMGLAASRRSQPLAYKGKQLGMESPKNKSLYSFEENSSSAFSSTGRMRDLMMLRFQHMRPVTAANMLGTRLPKARGIPYRKEELYDRVLQMKGEVNTVKTENVRLKTKMKQIEDKLGKRPADDPPLLADSLKTQIADMRAQLNARDEELAFIKKRLKFTKMTELENELKVTVDECMRLRRMLLEAMEELAQGITPLDLQERYLKLKADYKALRREFFEMSAYVRENKARSNSTKPEARKLRKMHELRANTSQTSGEFRHLRDSKCPKCGSDLAGSDLEPRSRNGKSINKILEQVWQLLWTQDLKVPDFWQRLDPEMLGAIKPHTLIETLRNMGCKLSHQEVEKVLEALGTSQGESVHRMDFEDVLERYRPPLTEDQSRFLAHFSLRVQSLRMHSIDLPQLLALPQPQCSLSHFSKALETSQLLFSEELSQGIAKVVFLGYSSMQTETVYARLAAHIGTVELLTPEKESELDTELKQLYSGKSVSLTAKLEPLDPRVEGIVSFSDFLSASKALGVALPLHLQNYLRVLFYSELQELDQVPYETFIQAYCLQVSP